MHADASGRDPQRELHRLCYLRLCGFLAKRDRCGLGWQLRDETLAVRCSKQPNDRGVPSQLYYPTGNLRDDLRASGSYSGSATYGRVRHPSRTSESGSRGPGGPNLNWRAWTSHAARAAGSEPRAPLRPLSGMMLGTACTPERHRGLFKFKLMASVIRVQFRSDRGW